VQCAFSHPAHDLIYRAADDICFAGVPTHRESPAIAHYSGGNCELEYVTGMYRRRFLIDGRPVPASSLAVPAWGCSEHDGSHNDPRAAMTQRNPTTPSASLSVRAANLLTIPGHYVSSRERLLNSPGSQTNTTSSSRASRRRPTRAVSRNFATSDSSTKTRSRYPASTSSRRRYRRPTSRSSTEMSTRSTSAKRSCLPSHRLGRLADSQSRVATNLLQAAAIHLSIPSPGPRLQPGRRQWRGRL
jgi:hypothetical protein